MKTQKWIKLLSLILVIVMTLSSFPAFAVIALAEEIDDPEQIIFLSVLEAKCFLATIRSCTPGDISPTDPQLLILTGDSDDKSEAGKLGKQIATYWTRFDVGEVHFITPAIENYFNGDYDIISDLTGAQKEKMYKDSL